MGYDDRETYNGHPGCPDAPWWWHERKFFRLTGFYDLEDIIDGRPKYTKHAHDIKFFYHNDAQDLVTSLVWTTQFSLYGIDYSIYRSERPIQSPG